MEAQFLISLKFIFYISNFHMVSKPNKLKRAVRSIQYKIGDSKESTILRGHVKGKKKPKSHIENFLQQ